MERRNIVAKPPIAARTVLSNSLNSISHSVMLSQSLNMSLIASSSEGKADKLADRQPVLHRNLPTIFDEALTLIKINAPILRS